MIVLDLFCGTKSIANAFERHGHQVFTVDWNEEFEPTLCADIGDLTPLDLIDLCGGVLPEVIWASPDCTTFSVAAISRHRMRQGKILVPTSDYAKECDKVDSHLVELIKGLNPRYWFIENPRGAMRKAAFMQELNIYRHTVTYCQYGDTRMKPTDIWTNHPNPQFKPPCKNGDKCHESAPRGSQRGTQGLGNAKNRAIIPVQLCEHIVKICEEGEIIWT